MILFIVSNLVLGGCSSEEYKSRKPGSAPIGVWYTGSSDACLYDNLVYRVDEKKILLHTLNYEADFFSYSWNVGKEKNQLILTLMSSIELTPEPVVVHFADEGNQLIPLEDYTNTGEVVGLGAYSQMLRLTACAEPGWLGSFRLLTGIDEPYQPNSRREPMPPMPRPQK